MQPGFPDPALGGRALVLPAGRVRFAPSLTQPRLTEAIAAVEQTLPGKVRVNTMYVRRRDAHGMRGVNVNAPFANATSRPAATTTATRSATIARPASRATPGSAARRWIWVCA